MSDEGSRNDHQPNQAIDGYLRRAERIGRIAAEESAPHEEAHRIASATAVLASTEYGRHAARARLRRSPIIHALLAAIIVVPLATALLPDGRGFTLFSLLSVIYLVVHAAELTVGSPIHRFAGRLPAAVQQFVSPYYPAFEHAVLSAYSAHSADAGRPGCVCGPRDMEA